MPTEERQLAAIMFTDMVGYSAMAQRDEALALGLLEEHRCIVREVLARFHGTEIKTIGDAFLLQFRSALEAVPCALEIQRTFAKRNHDVPRKHRIELKIGVHLGDVVHRDGSKLWPAPVGFASRKISSGKCVAPSLSAPRGWPRHNSASLRYPSKSLLIDDGVRHDKRVNRPGAGRAHRSNR